MSRHMNSRLHFFFSGLMALFMCLPANAGARIVQCMNTDWAFYRGDVSNGQEVGLDDSQWIPSVVPHVMQLEKKHCGGNAIYDGIGWYRRYFTVDPSHEGKKIGVSFEGVMTSCKVYLNGEEVAVHHGGYVGFAVDLTGKVKFGETNVLAVRVSAEEDRLTPPGKPQSGLDFYYHSGIYRDVELVIADKLHISDPLNSGAPGAGGVFITFPEVSKDRAIVQVSTHVRNDYEEGRDAILKSTLTDDRGNVVASSATAVRLEGGKDRMVRQELKLDNPRLWHPYSPYLYKLSSQVVAGGKVVDEVTTAAGIRTIKFTTEGGFFINGEHLYIRAANRHQAYPHVGDAASNSMQEREVIDMKRGGYNAVRAAHYPQDPAFLDACDKHGLMVVECIPGWQHFDNDPVFTERVCEVGRDMIRRDRNHPSVILWETALNETRYPAELAKTLHEIAHREYPGDQMYTAGDYFGHADLVDYYDVFYKQVSKFPKDGNVMSNYLEDQIAVKPLLTREWGDGAGKKPRVWLAENEQEQLEQCITRFEHLEGRGYFDWCMLDANPRMGGHMMWSYNDYTRGATEETMYSGVVDVNRYPKFGYYMLQSMRDRSISQTGLYRGPMVFIASFNSGKEFESSTSAITVFSNCDRVRLYRNNKLVGEQSREERAKVRPNVVAKGGSPDFVFDAGDYEEGELRAEGLIDNKVAATHKVATAGEPHHIEVVVADLGIAPVADGSDMMPVYFKVCDAKGNLVQSSDLMINVSVVGDGHLIGGGIERIGVSNQKVEGGIGFALVRTSKKAGQLLVRAQGEGLKEGRANVRTLPFKGTHVPDGLHRDFTGNEDDNAVVKPTTREKKLLALPVIRVKEVKADSSQPSYPAANVIDGDDRTWWISNEDSLPQTVTLELEEVADVKACRILFQKDSSSYAHKVEVSADGDDWQEVFDRECTGWDYKPREINRKGVRFFRLTFKSVSEGRPGLGEITLFAEEKEKK